MLGITGLREAGRMYAEGTDAHDPHQPTARRPGRSRAVQLVHRHPRRPPADARRFTTHARDTEIGVDYAEYPGMFHNWIMQNIPEGREAMNRGEQIVRRPTTKPGRDQAG
ncbi:MULTISPECIES: hypothetical protein [unclassified Amycolatopsis]|uniref:hypothetical protein n=1 Tax=unclassified Amycolatopsis TaxID=2618356 RepID=UPI0034522D37